MGKGQGPFKPRGRSPAKKNRAYEPPAPDIESPAQKVQPQQQQAQDPPSPEHQERYKPRQDIVDDEPDWEDVAPPPDKIFYPKDARLPDDTSHLTDSAAEEDLDTLGALDSSDSRVGIYHLARDDEPRKKHATPRHRRKLKQWYEKRIPILSQSTSRGDESASQLLSIDETRTGAETLGSQTDMSNLQVFSEDDYIRTKQDTAYLSIGLTAIQLLILMMQLAMCGVASLDINPMVGPFPDAFSEWGGKNAYLILNDDQWWRLITAAFLHVGVLHLFANAFCQLETVALFEREWGSFRWLLVYLLSAVGCNVYACLFDPDSISVGSSGALMGMYAAKLSQVMSHTFFDITKAHEDDVIRLDQLSGVLCGLTLVSLLSSFTYIDWSGHMGGLVTGFFSGMLFFCRPINNCCIRILWAFAGLTGLVASLTAVLYYFVTAVEPAEEIGDACEWFRSLFPENYECGCMWQ